MTGPCSRESDVVAAVIEGHWPGAGDGDLEAHIAECPACRDAAEVCGLLREVEVSDTQTKSVDADALRAASCVWLRAALRLRADAEHDANRSLTWALGIGGACAVGLGLSALSALGPTLTWLTSRSATWIARLGARAGAATDVTVSMLLEHVPSALPIVAGLALTPLAVLVTCFRSGASSDRRTPPSGRDQICPTRPLSERGSALSGFRQVSSTSGKGPGLPRSVVIRVGDS